MWPMGHLPDEVLRSRRTASVARATLALVAVVLLAADHRLATLPVVCASGFAIIAATAGVQLAMPHTDWLKLEESLAPLSAVLIIGLGPQRVGVLSILWLAAVACGVIARGGRVGGVGRALLLASLILPLLRDGTITLAYGGLILAAIALLLTCGRMTRELRGMLDRARYAANHDGLTGALSRAAFRDRLDAVAADPDKHRNLAVLLVDLDNFGAINKASGHATGDAVLRTVVGRLGETVAESGIVGRLGGDEFGLVVGDPIRWPWRGGSWSGSVPTANSTAARPASGSPSSLAMATMPRRFCAQWTWPCGWPSAPAGAMCPSTPASPCRLPEPAARRRPWSA
jgi:GGDEF domain-containing protein